MNRRLPLFLVCPVLILVGCQGIDLTGAKSASRGGPVVQQVAPPSFATDSQIVMALWHKRLRVGDRGSEAEAMFPEHSRWYETNDLQTPFGKDYQARIWSKNDDGFGMVLYDGKVALALANFSGATQEGLTEVLAAEERAMPGLRPTVYTNDQTVYRFWEDDTTRLMVCWYAKDGRTQLTVAIGDKSCMDAIGAAPKSPPNDQASAPTHSEP